MHSHIQLMFLFCYNSQSHQHNHFPYNAIATFYSSSYITTNYMGMYTKSAMSVMIMTAMCDENDDDKHRVVAYRLDFWPMPLPQMAAVAFFRVNCSTCMLCK